jgi:hypothetical protein
MVMMAAFLLGTAVPGFAQQPEETEKYKEDRQKDLNREMTLEREYDPIVQDAAKVNTLPVVREINISKRPIVYSDYALPVLPDKELQTLPAGTLMTDVPHSVRNGYLHFAGGMLMNFDGDAGYRLLNTERDQLKISFSHRSTDGNVGFSADSISGRKAKRSDQTGGLDFKHLFDAATLSLGGAFGYSSFNYYGLPANTPAGGSSDTATNQGSRYINVYASMVSGAAYSAGYRIGVDYKQLNRQYALSKEESGMTENNIGLLLGLHSPSDNDRYFGVDLKMNVLAYTAPFAGKYSFIADSAAFDNRCEATLNPYYQLAGDRLRLRLGLKLMLLYQTEADMLASPDITLETAVGNWSLFYVNLGGGIESNTMYELSRRNCYLNPVFAPDASLTWADMKLGWRSSASANLWFDIFGGYKYTEADVFYNPSSYDWIADGFNNVSMVFQPTTRHIQAGATLKYDHRQVFDFYLKGVYHHYLFKYLDTWKNVCAAPGLDENSVLDAYGKPTATLHAGLHVRPVKALTLGLYYHMLSGMKAYINKETVKMNPVNDLGLRASWTFGDAFGIYALCNNLLFRKQELYYGYPLQPFTVMGGFSVNF